MNDLCKIILLVDHGDSKKLSCNENKKQIKTQTHAPPPQKKNQTHTHTPLKNKQQKTRLLIFMVMVSIAYIKNCIILFP